VITHSNTLHIVSHCNCGQQCDRSTDIFRWPAEDCCAWMEDRSGG